MGCYVGRISTVRVAKKTAGADPEPIRQSAAPAFIPESIYAYLPPAS